MPNGKPGDSPLTDILNYNMEVYGQEGDDLVREIVRLGGTDQLAAEPIDLLRQDPRFDHDLDLAALTEKLRSLRDQLKAEAIERGWDVD